MEASNETWLFSGASEKWTALTITTEVPRARFGHEAISHYRTESSCQCKESVIVFGGKDAYKSLLHDMWELQCVDDRNEASAKYRWVELKTNLRPLKEYKLNRLTPFSVNNTHIDDNQRAWIFDLKTERWSSMLINIVFSNNETISMLGSAEKFDTIGNVYVRQHRLFIFLVSASLMGVYNVEQNRFQFINVEIYGNMQTTTFVAKMMTLRKTLLLLSSKSQTDHGIALWELEINNLLEALESNCSDSTLLFRKIAFVERYPRLQWDSKIIGITDTVWYLMQESQQKVEMWRFELDSLMWTLYDPDQMPGINPGLIKKPRICDYTLVVGELSFVFDYCYTGARFEAAYSATKKQGRGFLWKLSRI